MASSLYMHHHDQRGKIKITLMVIIIIIITIGIISIFAIILPPHGHRVHISHFRPSNAMGRRPKPPTERRQAWEAQRSDLTAEHDAGQKLADWFLRLYADGTLSAKHVCIGCHYACKAGAVGDVSKYALEPTATGGHFQRHLGRVLPGSTTAPELCIVEVPLRSRKAGRGKRRTLFAPVHECLAAEVVQHGLSAKDVDDRADMAEWGPAFRIHRASQPRLEDGRPCFPVALYMDSVRFTKSIMPGHMDSLLNISVYNLVSMKRHFVGMLRKSELCRCGCQGWCSLYPVWIFLEWCFKQARAGTRSLERHDGADWPADSVYGGKATDSPQLPALFVLAQVKGDWAEFCQAFGYPTWASSFSPCLMCNCTKEQMYDFSGLSLLRDPWGSRAAGDYNQA